jgi:hypothetical protein
MGLTIQLLGRPRLVKRSGEAYRYAAAAVLLAADIENPSLERLVVAGTGQLTASTQITGDRPLLHP